QAPTNGTAKAIRVPSGDQAGGSRATPAGPTGLTPLPSAFMMAIWRLAPYRVVTNAIVDPLGEKAAPESHAGSTVSPPRPVPSALTAQISRLPVSTSQLKAIRPPSGDQAGCPRNPTLSVTCVTADPSAFIT